MKYLFQGNLLSEHETERKTLVRHIEQKAGSRIAKTRLVYAYDPLNPTNFHKYIDNLSGLALVVKTINSAFVAGFYSGNYNEKEEILNSFSLLISLTNDDSFVLQADSEGKASKKANRGMIYDKFYAIYGNAELRVKTGEKKVFSNFATVNAYFNNRGKKVVDFLNSESRETEF